MKILAELVLVLVGWAVIVSCVQMHRVNNTEAQIAPKPATQPHRYWMKTPGFDPVPLTHEEFKFFQFYHRAFGPVDVREI